MLFIRHVLQIKINYLLLRFLVLNYLTNKNQGELNCDFKTITNDIWTDVEDVYKWNKNIDFSRRLMKFTENMDVIHV